jgi:NAD(P)-dependent dehydrogenase (short-subunit alcohol dehydrogenase family)/enoyl-CoA hydratase/carnithine racemase
MTENGFRQFDMSGKTALITGASRGIGAATARAFAAQGANVVLMARDRDAIAGLAGEIGAQALAVPVDVSRYWEVEAAVTAAVDSFGTVDILINNAGAIEPVARMEAADPVAWGQVIDINLKGVFHGMHAVLPVMLGQGGGSIITISSGAAHNPLEGWSHYCASKAAVAMLTRCLHLEHGASGIRAMGLSPGHGRDPDAEGDQGLRREPGEPAGLVRSHPAGMARRGAVLDVLGGVGHASGGGNLAPLTGNPGHPGAHGMIRVDRDGPLWTVVLDRPDKANSLTGAMLRTLADVATEAAEAPELRALILTGAGEKVFSAGADLEEAHAGLATAPVWEEVSDNLAALECLTIAALNGTLAGGAFGMALACDIRIAVPNARFFYPVAKLGFLPQPSDPGRMRALMGPARTKLLLLGGQKLTADEAFAYGLIDRIVAPEHLMDAAHDIAADALAGKPDILRGIKAMSTG